MARVVDGIIYGMGTTATDATIMMLATRETMCAGLCLRHYRDSDDADQSVSRCGARGIRKDPGRTILRTFLRRYRWIS